MSWVYIIRGQMAGKKRYYVGYTARDPVTRFKEHMSGTRARYTKNLTKKKLIVGIRCHGGKAVENYLKKHREVVYHLVRDRNHVRAYQNFVKWCKTYQNDIEEVVYY